MRAHKQIRESIAYINRMNNFKVKNEDYDTHFIVRKEEGCNILYRSEAFSRGSQALQPTHRQ